jgi:hypothetical protein
LIYWGKERPVVSGTGDVGPQAAISKFVEDFKINKKFIFGNFLSPHIHTENSKKDK